MVFDHQGEYASQYEAIRSVAQRIGYRSTGLTLHAAILPAARFGIRGIRGIGCIGEVRGPFLGPMPPMRFRIAGVLQREGRPFRWASGFEAGGEFESISLGGP
jgi:hypothetical protein